MISMFSCKNLKKSYVLVVEKNNKEENKSVFIIV